MMAVSLCHYVAAKRAYERFDWVIKNVAPLKAEASFKKPSALVRAYYVEFVPGDGLKLARGKESILFNPLDRASKSLFNNTRENAEVYVDADSGLPVAVGTKTGIIFRNARKFLSRPVFEKESRLAGKLALIFAAGTISLLIAFLIVYYKDVRMFAAFLSFYTSPGSIVSDDLFRSRYQSLKDAGMQFAHDDIKRWLPDFAASARDLEMNNLDSASRYLDSIIEGRRPVGLKADPVIAIARTQKGMIAVRKNDCDEAIEQFKRAEEILSDSSMNKDALKVTGFGFYSVIIAEPSRLTVDASTNLSHALEMKGAKKEAEAKLLGTIRSSKKAGGKADARVLLELAALLRRSGRDDDASRELKEALDVMTSGRPTNTYAFAGHLERQAEWLRERGDLIDALEVYKHSVAVRKKEAAYDAPAIARNELNQARVCSDLGLLAEAEAIYKRILKSADDRSRAERQNKGGEQKDGPTIDRTYPVIGLAEIAQRRSMAFPLKEVENALLDREKHPDAEGESIAWPLHLLANHFRDAGNASKAEVLYESALARRKAALRKADPRTIRMLEDYALLKRKNGQEKEASALESEAGDLRKAIAL